MDQAALDRGLGLAIAAAAAAPADADDVDADAPETPRKNFSQRALLLGLQESCLGAL